MYRITLLFVGIILLVSCGKQDTDKPDSPRIKKATSVVTPSMNQEETLGNNVSFSISAESKVDSVEVLSNGSEKMFYSSTFDWKPNTIRTGVFSFQVKVYCKGAEEVHYPRLRMLSDVVPEQYTYISMGAYEHDTDAYTQGLFFLDNILIESTGERGKSTIRKVHPVTGQVLQNVPLGDQFFGEGCTVYKDKIYQLTWTSRQGFIYDNNLNQTGTFQYNTDGWGITTMGDSLIMTDGSEKVYFMNPQGFSEIDHLEVYTDKGMVDNLNELELVNGLLYANEYQTNKIHVIEPSTGRVLKTIDLAGLLTPEEARKADVLNGIAYNEETDQLFVTGKWWPWLFEIKLQPKNTQL
jgi:glutamine cyclotransferase